MQNPQKVEQGMLRPHVDPSRPITGNRVPYSLTLELTLSIRDRQYHTQETYEKR